jgi:hypothetical protein
VRVACHSAIAGQRLYSAAMVQAIEASPLPPLSGGARRSVDDAAPAPVVAAFLHLDVATGLALPAIVSSSVTDHPPRPISK